MAAAFSSVPPFFYAEMVAQAGISFEAFGLELEMGVPQPGMFTRDLFQLSSLLGDAAQQRSGVPGFCRRHGHGALLLVGHAVNHS